MGFRSSVKEKALVSCGRHCCLCHKFYGIYIELHHIIAKVDGGKDTFDNCIPLCFNCHAHQRSIDFKHPRGTKYTTNELKQHRDNWYARFLAKPAEIYDDKTKNIDKRTYQRTIRYLPWEGGMHMVAERDLLRSDFHIKEVHHIYKYLTQTTDPQNQFLDPDFEACRADLEFKLRAFLKYLDNLTIKGVYSDYYEIPKRPDLNNREYRQSVIDKFAGPRAEAVEAYRTFVSMAKRAYQLG